MSGIVALVWGENRLAHEPTLANMTARLHYRGPHGQATWTDNLAGLGHAMLNTDSARPRSAQPLTIDNQIWITADARLDDRQRLVTTLHRHGASVTLLSSDEELILAAYRQFGPDCVQHLLGDFAFAIWDRPARRLLAAVDRFAIRPLYYAVLGTAFVTSNCLDTLRRHPDIGTKIAETALADFLAFGFYGDPGATLFEGIQRLPPAHSVLFENGRAGIQKYWSPGMQQLELPSNSKEVIELFQTTFRAAVSDRLVAGSQNLLLSGGIDSAMLAATAIGLQRKNADKGVLLGHTAVYEHLIPDDEGYFAKLVAESLGLRISLYVADDLEVLDWVDGLEWTPPEPLEMPGLGTAVRLYRKLAAESSVVFTGHDGDTLFKASYGKHFFEQFRQGTYGQLIRDLAWYGLRKRRVPILGWLSHRDSQNKPKPPPPIPAWLRPEWLNHVGLQERWRDSSSLTTVSSPRARVAQALSSPFYARTFDVFDPAYTGQALEFRHPFMDARVVDLLVALPSVPWCVDKELLRQSLRGHVPDPVRLRPKTPLREDPVVLQLAQRAEASLSRSLHPDLERFIDSSKLSLADGGQVWTDLRVFSLNAWWRQRMR